MDQARDTPTSTQAGKPRPAIVPSRLLGLNKKIRPCPIVDTKFTVKLCDVLISATQWKDLAGNAFNARVVGGLAAFMLANIVLRERGSPEYPLPVLPPSTNEDPGAEGDIDTTSPATPTRKRSKRDFVKLGAGDPSDNYWGLYGTDYQG